MKCYEGLVQIETFTVGSYSKNEQKNNERIYGYDAWTNQVYPVEITSAGEVVVCIEPRKSIILVLDKKDDTLENSILENINSAEKTVEQKLKEYKLQNPDHVRELKDGWKRSVCRSIEYPSFKEEKDISLPDRLSEEQPLFSGIVRYEKKFILKDCCQVFLEITDAAEGVEVFLNGKSLGIQIVPHYIYNLSDVAIRGENKLAIEVATTLEREMSVTPNLYGMPKKDPKCGSGITGIVRLYA